VVSQSSLPYKSGTKPLSPYWIATAGALAGCFRNVHNNYATGTLWVDPYWISFYLTNFKDGYRRRALIGSLCRFLFPAGMNVVLINAVAVLVLLLCMAWFIRSVGRLSLREPTLRSSLFLFALSASAVTAVFAEVLGDTLQIAFLFFVFTMLLARRLQSPSLQRLLALGALTLGFFIHEASIFFLAPALPFFLKERPKLREFALLAAALRLF
jgi:hypothetical protein